MKRAPRTNATSRTGETGKVTSREPVAIVGIGCRFPKASGPQQFWQLLTQGIDAISEVPKNRFDLERFFDPTPATPGKVSTKWGGFLDEIDKLDAYFFGLSPREAERLDPQQRLLLEVAWEALEDAGQSLERMQRLHTGVFVGMWINDFEDRLFADPDQVDFYMTTGSGRYSASGRISYALGFQGPAITIDTACSSSLVAVHLASQSLRTGECEVALAGGANTILQPHISIAYSQSKMLSPDGRCKFGDARANGYVRSEGAGIIVLKTLSKALADNDRIYAVIHGSAVNNDGKTSGFLATPGVGGQVDMLRKAYADAGISPGNVHYVEAHGTGTSAGDPVEIQALGTVLAEGRKPGQRCILGSVKTNVGHTEGAAGVAGLIKTALALHHKKLPPTLHFQTPNPKIPWESLPVEVKAELLPWPETGDPAVAGVSSFGIAGTNAHVVLGETPAQVVSRNGAAAAKNTAAPAAFALPLSAQTPEALRELATAYTDLLRNLAPDGLIDLCYTASLRRTHLDQRLMAIGRDRDSLRDLLLAYSRDEQRPGLAKGVREGEWQRKIVFVFPGQGSQWLGMARDLLQNAPVFRAQMQQCEQAFRAFVDWSPIEQLTATGQESRLQEIDVIQPTLFAIYVSLAAQWRAWGVLPDAVVGHSMGEVAAAHVAGALSLDDAAKIICTRSKLLRRTSGKGAMAVVELTMDDARQVLQGYEDRLSIAVSNSSRSTVIAGDPLAIDEVLQKLEADGIFCRKIKVDVASHSPQMDPLKDDLLAALQGLQPRKGSVPMYSTVLNQVVAGDELDERYWVNNLRQPVLLARSIQQLHKDGYDVFVELSPHPILLPAIQQELQEHGKAGVALPSMRRDEEGELVLLESLGHLHCQGYPVPFEQLFTKPGRLVELPSYPWQREHFWIETSPRQRLQKAGDHPLLALQFRPASQPSVRIWEGELHQDDLPYLGDHRVRDTAVFPAAGFAELMLAAGRGSLGASISVLEQTEFHEALFVPSGEQTPLALQVVVHQLSPESASCRVLSRAGSASDDDAAWTLHAHGVVRAAGETHAPAAGEDLQQIRSRCAEHLDANGHYQAAFARRLHYGAAFQGVQELWRGDNEAVARIALPESLAGSQSPYRLHPALLDAAFQVLLDLLPQADDADARATFLPTGLKQLWLAGKTPAADGGLWLHARGSRDASGDNLSGHITLRNDAGEVLLQTDGLRLQRVRQEAGDAVQEWLYDRVWREQAAGDELAPKTDGRWLVISDQRGVGERVAARLAKQQVEVLVAQPGNAFHQKGAGRFTIRPGDPGDLAAMLAEAARAAGMPLAGVLYFGALDDGDSVADAPVTAGTLGVVALVQALLQAELPQLPRLWLLTTAAQPAPETPALAVAQAPLWGFGAVLASEHPELRCSRLDLSAEAPEDELDALVSEVLRDGADDQLALRGAKRFVAQLERAPQRDVAAGSAKEEGRRPTTEVDAFAVHVDQVGVLDHLTLRETARRRPAPGEVEIRVESAGLNFLDVMKAMGVYPGLDPQAPVALGGECAGVVAAVGAGVDHLREGDAVVAITPSFTRTSLLASHVTVPAVLVVPKPERMSFAQAAGFPIAFLTAYYALIDLGRMRKGERVLIHAASGGVGLAAIQLARLVGAEVFATAGSEEKRAYLRGLGIEHVMDSRSVTFAGEILDITGGEGVDLVLNSLTGEALAKNFDLLRPYGRFLEIGKRDIYQNSLIGLEPFKKNLALFAIDLAAAVEERRDVMAAHLREVTTMLDDGRLQPLPHEIYPISQVADAFRQMAQARHTGKLVLALDDDDARVAPSSDSLPIRGDGLYLITGGLGGLGLTIARWLVHHGAQHLVLTGRSEPSASASAAVDELRGLGATVRILQADISDGPQVAKLFAEIDAAAMPLRGVVHAAGVLADSTIAQMTPERFQQAMAPKVLGAWHLHQQTRERELDFFLLYSSVAAILGTAGQSNYAAGNAFLDALAHARRLDGLPAMSINWGPWAEVGLAAAQENRGERLQSRGLGSLDPASGMLALQYLLRQDVPQAIVMSFDFARWREYLPSTAEAPFFALLAGESAQPPAPVVTAAAVDIRDSLTAAEPGKKRRAVFEEFLKEHIAKVLKVAPQRVGLNTPLRSLGLDSLMALELRNRLEAALQVKLRATLFWNYPTVTLLAPVLAELMDIPLDQAVASSTPAETPASDELESVLAELEGLSEEEAQQLLKNQ